MNDIGDGGALKARCRRSGVQGSGGSGAAWLSLPQSATAQPLCYIYRVYLNPIYICVVSTG